MTIQIRNGSLDTSISRRGFVSGAAGMTFAFTLGGIGRGGEALGATQPTKFNAWAASLPTIQSASSVRRLKWARVSTHPCR